MIATEAGIAALVLGVVMCMIIAGLIAAAGEGSADTHRIESGVTLDADAVCNPPCGARHCLCAVPGLRAQRYPELVTAQRDVHRWNLPTMAMPVVGDIVPITAVLIVSEYEPLGYERRQTPTDLAGAYELPAAPARRELVGATR